MSALNKKLPTWVKTVLGAKETLLALIPTADGILMQTMFFEDEIKELPKSYTKHEVGEAELTMAKTLISSMEQPFEPSAYPKRTAFVRADTSVW